MCSFMPNRIVCVLGFVLLAVIAGSVSYVCKLDSPCDTKVIARQTRRECLDGFEPQGYILSAEDYFYKWGMLQHVGAQVRFLDLRDYCHDYWEEGGWAHSLVLTGTKTGHLWTSDSLESMYRSGDAGFDLFVLLPPRGYMIEMPPQTCTVFLLADDGWESFLLSRYSTACGGVYFRPGHMPVHFEVQITDNDAEMCYTEEGVVYN